MPPLHKDLNWEAPPPPSDASDLPWVRLSVSNAHSTPMAHIIISRPVIESLGWEAGRDALALRIGRDAENRVQALELRPHREGEIGRPLRQTRGAKGSGQFYCALPADMNRRLVSLELQHWKVDPKDDGTLELDVSGIFYLSNHVQEPVA